MKKANEIVFDFRKRQIVINQICIGNDGVEIVCKHKYLGTVTCGDLKGLVTSRNRSRKLIKDYIFLGNSNFYTSVIQNMLQICRGQTISRWNKKVAQK